MPALDRAAAPRLGRGSNVREIELDDTSGRAVELAGRPNPFSVPASGFVPSGRTGHVVLDVVPEAFAREIPGAEIVARIALFGHARGDGGEVASRAFELPVAICMGCLVRCVEGAPPTACRPGQDRALDLACL